MVFDYKWNVLCLYQARYLSYELYMIQKDFEDRLFLITD